MNQIKKYTKAIVGLVVLLMLVCFIIGFVSCSKSEEDTQTLTIIRSSQVFENINDKIIEAEEQLNEPEETYSEAVYYTPSYYEESYEEGVLTRSGGVNYYDGRKETWYSQRTLPGGGLDIPGRHVDENGLIRDEDGYICVAASDLERGTVVNTSLGEGKVYDCGCADGTTDIYTDW